MRTADEEHGVISSLQKDAGEGLVSKGGCQAAQTGSLALPAVAVATSAVVEAQARRQRAPEERPHSGIHSSLSCCCCCHLWTLISGA